MGTIIDIRTHANYSTFKQREKASETKMAKMLLAFMKYYRLDNGGKEPPVDEIVKALGLKSSSQARFLLNNLKQVHN